MEKKKKKDETSLETIFKLENEPLWMIFNQKIIYFLPLLEVRRTFNYIWYKIFVSKCYDGSRC